MVSAIVCAYNEEKTVKPILEVLLAHPKVNEVIVVNDGSTDRTGKIIESIKSAKLIKIHHTKNLGKGAAAAAAVRESKGEILLFIDADLIHFRPPHVDLLLAPLNINEKIMTIGLREARQPHEKTFGLLMRSFGGERAVLKKFIRPNVKRLETSGYGAEVIINLSHLKKHRPVLYIPLPGLVHKTKQQKHPIYKYAVDYLKENTDILKQYLLPENRALMTFFKQISRRLNI
jgi:glycosyltransferase involved in cell wall biosynthesis